MSLNIVIQYQICSGHAAIYDNDVVAISNLHDGLDVYSLKPEHGQLVNQIKYEVSPKRNREVQTCITNGGKWLVVGGTDGLVQVFDRMSGQPVHIFSSPGGQNYTQTIAVYILYMTLFCALIHHPQTYDGPNSGFIVTAGSNSEGEDNAIQVWSYVPKEAALVRYLIPLVSQNLTVYRSFR